jgi:glycosyltransferase involved in cell wall biosynthesis
MNTKNKLVSIIMPVRGRISKLKNCAESIAETVDDFSRVEVILITDLDDDETSGFIDSTVVKILPDLRHLRVPRSDNFIRDYHNYGISQSNGKLIWGLADDNIILTKGWDTFLNDFYEDKIATTNKGLAYVIVGGEHINSNPFQGDISKFCTFPMLTSKTKDVNGEILISAHHSWGSDRSLALVYKELKEKGYDLIHDLSDDIKIKHISIHTGTDVRDEAYYRMERAAAKTNYSEVQRSEYNMYMNILNFLRDASSE